MLLQNTNDFPFCACLFNFLKLTLLILVVNFSIGLNQYPFPLMSFQNILNVITAHSSFQPLFLPLRFYKYILLIFLVNLSLCLNQPPSSPPLLTSSRNTWNVITTSFTSSFIRLFLFFCRLSLVFRVLYQYFPLSHNITFKFVLFSCLFLFLSSLSWYHGLTSIFFRRSHNTSNFLFPPCIFLFLSRLCPA